MNRTRAIVIVWFTLFAALAATGAWAQTEADFKVEPYEDGVSITGYSGWETNNLVIPAAIGGKKVVRIGGSPPNRSGYVLGAFEMQNLTGSVTMPPTVRSIGTNAFKNNKLTGVVIPEGVTVIEVGAFEQNNLTNVVIPDSVRVIAHEAFWRNPLTSVTLGKGLVSIGSGYLESGSFLPFHSPLKSVTLAAGYTFKFFNDFGLAVYYDYLCNGRKAGTYTIKPDYPLKNKEGFHYYETQYGVFIQFYAGESRRMDVPERINGKPVKYVCGSLANTSAVGIRYSEGIVGIGDGPNNKVRLPSVEIPDSVTYLGNGAFRSNSGRGDLERVTLGSGLEYIGEEAFYYNSITAIVIPPNVTCIDDKAFASNPLSSVTIGANVALGKEAIPGKFEEAYARNNRQAGTYISGTGGTWSPASERPLINTMRLIPGGSFWMGNTDGRDDEKPSRPVKLTKSFYIGKTEVTQQDWREVMGTNPSAFKGDNLPVENVSWYDAVEFCNKLSLKEGLTPVYSGSGDAITCDWKADGYRLPTEAEWEYAARSGEIPRAPAPALDSIAWYRDNSGGATHPVGTKAPNNAGLYDMIGNVGEWCWDRYGPYRERDQTDPTGAPSGDRRVIRGGSWNDEARRIGSFSRRDNIPAYRNSGLGFRIVRLSL